MKNFQIVLYDHYLVNMIHNLLNLWNNIHNMECSSPFQCQYSVEEIFHTLTTWILFYLYVCHSFPSVSTLSRRWLRFVTPDFLISSCIDEGLVLQQRVIAVGSTFKNRAFHTVSVWCQIVSCGLNNVTFTLRMVSTFSFSFQSIVLLPGTFLLTYSFVVATIF